ncbi:MAG: amino acid permease [Lachnospiraceae bacterium]|nr:amino acid permease [Lachnospiraceae bacterium]
MEKTAENRLIPNLGMPGAWAFSLGTTIGWGSLVVTSNTYLAQAGPAGSALGLVLGALVMLLIARSYAYLIQCYPEAGGAYSYVREVFGYDHGFLTAWFLALTYLAVFWANVTSLPLFARYFLGGVFCFGRMYTLLGYTVYFGEILLSVAAICVTAWLCSRHRNLAAGAMIVMAVLFTIGILAVFAAAMAGGGRNIEPAYVPDSAALGQIVKIAVISPWAFIGFENISHCTEEFSFRRSRVFSVLVVSLVTGTLLYICVTILSVTAYPPEYESWLQYIRDLGNLSGIRALPAFYAANHYMGSAGVGILAASLLALVLTSLIGNMTAVSRLFYALGKDQVLPRQIGVINQSGSPGNAILLVLGLSVLIPFLGRTPIGWIVDVTTIGATIIYGFVSVSAWKLAGLRGDTSVRRTGLAGFCIMLAFGVYLLVPNLISVSSMARETYFLFIVWSVLGFLFFRSILHRDESRRFGKSIIVWVALLALVLFIALIWMRQSMISSNQQMLAHIQSHYQETLEISETRLEDEVFIEREMELLESANTRTILMATGMFLFSLVIMMTNYTYMNKRAKESELIANTDPMTGVKSKHAYLVKEKELNDEIGRGGEPCFAIAVCDVNGLKYVNDTYGHKAGDDYIRAAARLICELFQHSPVYRIGGDEFVVVMSGRDYENREELLRSLRGKSEEHIGSDRVVVAAGLAEYRKNDASVHSVFERADTLMYSHKQMLKEKGARTR